jgi:hypothetical protein
MTSMNRGIHSRGYLPHWDFSKSVQAVTFRLADSMPKSVILEWKREIGSAGDDSFIQKELHRRIAKYEDAGHGETILADEFCATLVQDKLIENHGISYKLIAWVIMPNHVHVLMRILEGYSLSPIIKNGKERPP